MKQTTLFFYLFSFCFVSCIDIQYPEPTKAIIEDPDHDFDEDGQTEAEGDCDDENPLNFYDNDEVCDGSDNDCDGEIDEITAIDIQTWYLDEDGDGYGQQNRPLVQCYQPQGYAPATEFFDCDDTSDNINPGKDELCDGGIDNDCDTFADELDPEGVIGDATWYVDADNDGFGNLDDSIESCEKLDGYTLDGGDCDDTKPLVNPLAQEICNGFDDNCDELMDDEDPTTQGTTDWFADVDGDGYGNFLVPSITQCDQPTGYVINNQDCNDNPNDNGQNINPTMPEICNEVDDNCDGATDENVQVLYYLDADADGFGNPEITTFACDFPTTNTYSLQAGDCLDIDSSVNPNAPEVCNDKDDNCNGVIDEDLRTIYYLDADGDGAGNVNVSVDSCYVPEGYAENYEDCDDTSPFVSPYIIEFCDGRDNNCDGLIDEDGADGATRYYADQDGDGYGNANIFRDACEPPLQHVTNDIDCDDGRGNVNPFAIETCATGYDDNCDGDTTEEDALECREFFADRDNDGFGDLFDSKCLCSAVDEYVRLNNSDCEDNIYEVNPNQYETCLTPYDDDCSGTDNDIDALDCTIYYYDYDGDGFGTEDRICMCDTEMGFTALEGGDCQDTIFGINPDATEVCDEDGFDEDCNGLTNDASASDAITSYFDGDQDGFGSPLVPFVGCEIPVGYVLDDTDCSDARPTVNPEATETCLTSYDDDCNGIALEEDAEDCLMFYADVDEDGYGHETDGKCLCTFEDVYTRNNNIDCNDTVAEINPGRLEDCSTEVDDDCTGSDNDIDSVGCTSYYWDDDGDGYGTSDRQCTCVPENQYSATETGDCKDDNVYINPGLDEICDDNSTDENCDGRINDSTAIDAVRSYLDGDADGYGSPNFYIDDCKIPQSYTEDSTDCADGLPNVNPGAQESCYTAYDDNCNENVNDEYASGCLTYYEDKDDDGYGTQETKCLCEPEGDFRAKLTNDCDDEDPDVSLSNLEFCSTDVDDDCDGLINEDNSFGCKNYYKDSDGDGYGIQQFVCACEPYAPYTTQTIGDCDDSNSQVYPGSVGGCASADDISISPGNAAAVVWVDDEDNYVMNFDYNNDGIDDLALTDHEYDNDYVDPGAVLVFLGPIQGIYEAGVTLNADLVFSVDELKREINNVAAADIDYDGVDELFAFSTENNGSNVQDMWQIDDGLDGIGYVDETTQGVELSDYYGITTYRDVTGDGFAEVKIGDYWVDEDGSLTTAKRWTFGDGIVDDWDGDGVEEMWSLGQRFLYERGANGDAPFYYADLVPAFDHYLGDVDGDGWGDFANVQSDYGVYNPFTGATTINGRMWVYSGIRVHEAIKYGTPIDEDDPDLVITGADGNAQIYKDIYAAGDFNYDGFDDVKVYSATKGHHLILGPMPLDGSEINDTDLLVTASLEGFYHSTSSNHRNPEIPIFKIEDANGDGAMDFWIGRKYAKSSSSYGRGLYLIHGIPVQNRIDSDGDGYPSTTDCNDNDPNFYPRAPETGQDQFDYNCDGKLVKDEDIDGDGHTNETDCDDRDPLTYPGAAFNDSSTACLRDADGDGYGDPGTCYHVLMSDATDGSWDVQYYNDYQRLQVYSDNTTLYETLRTTKYRDRSIICFSEAKDYTFSYEVKGNSNSNRLTGNSFIIMNRDQEALIVSDANPLSTYPYAGTEPLLTVTVTDNGLGTDCNDNDADIFPGTDADGDGVDACYDCNDTRNSKGAPYEYYLDADYDGFGAGPVIKTCILDTDYDGTPEYVDNNNDCDDTNDKVFPGSAGNDSETECLADNDGDGYGTFGNCYKFRTYTSFINNNSNNKNTGPSYWNNKQTSLPGDSSIRTHCISPLASERFEQRRVTTDENYMKNAIAAWSAAKNTDACNNLGIDLSVFSDLTENVAGDYSPPHKTALEATNGAVNIYIDGEYYTSVIDIAATYNDSSPNTDQTLCFPEGEVTMDMPNGLGYEADELYQPSFAIFNASDEVLFVSGVYPDAVSIEGGDDPLLTLDIQNSGNDCNDSSAQTFPGAAENESATDCMADEDQDGFGDFTPTLGVKAGTDCDDSVARIFPGATDKETDTSACYKDDDDDGYGDLYAPEGFGYTVGSDCDDAREDVYPGNLENEVDPTGCYLDDDEDGYGDKYNESDVYAVGTDCADDQNYTYPGAASLDSTTECMADEGDDGFGDVNVDVNFINVGTDCSDTDETTYPGAAYNDSPDLCLQDSDGDGYAATAFGSYDVDKCFDLYMYDTAGDGWYGESRVQFYVDDVLYSEYQLESGSSQQVRACVPYGVMKVGYYEEEHGFSIQNSFKLVDDILGELVYADPAIGTVIGVDVPYYQETILENIGTDCYDDRADTYPGSAIYEDPNYCGVDDDMDGYGRTSDFGQDCVDDDANTYPGSSLNEPGDLCGVDADGDGYARQDDGGQDCNDDNADVYPGSGHAQYEVDQSRCYRDDDLDGYGDFNDGGQDCDDSNAEAYPGAAEHDSTELCMLDSDGDGYGAVYPSSYDTYCFLFGLRDSGADGWQEDTKMQIYLDDVLYEEIQQKYGNGFDVIRCYPAGTLSIGYTEAPDENENSLFIKDPLYGTTLLESTILSETDVLAGEKAIFELDLDYPVGTDCDDDVATTFPGAAELDSTTECLADADDDGYGSMSTCYWVNMSTITAGGWTDNFGINTTVHASGDVGTYVSVVADGSTLVNLTKPHDYSNYYTPSDLLLPAKFCGPYENWSLSFTVDTTYGQGAMFSLVDPTSGYIYESVYNPISGEHHTWTSSLPLGTDPDDSDDTKTPGDSGLPDTSGQ